MPNPFITDVPVAPDDLIDREGELRRLLESVEGGHNARLSAPRRYGKTSLLLGLEGGAKDVGMNAVRVDFFGVASLTDVVIRLERAYVEALKGPLAKWYAGLRRRWRLRIKGGLPGTGLELESLTDSQAEDLLLDLLDLPKEIFERTGNATLVAFDEFQELLAARDGVDGLIRSRIQLHRHEASYVFAGSHPGLMAQLFDDRERPLYGQARPVELGPLDPADLAEFIESRFSETGRDVGGALEQLLDLVRGHPQRAMLMAHHLWEATGPAGAAGVDEWDAAMSTALAELQEGFERFWETLSVNERRTLSAVAWIGPFGGGDTLYSSSTQARFQLTKGTTRDVVRQLERAGELARTEAGVPYLVDPLLEAWIASLRRPRS